MLLQSLILTTLSSHFSLRFSSPAANLLLIPLSSCSLSCLPKGVNGDITIGELDISLTHNLANYRSTSWGCQVATIFIKESTKNT
jgi:hypothetical protein